MGIKTNKNRADDLFLRYLKKELKDEELAELKLLIKNDTVNSENYKELFENWLISQSVSHLTNKYDYNKGFDRFKQKIKESKKKNTD